MTLAGLRPGEKLYEEKLMAEEGLKKTRNELIHIGCPIPFEVETFLKELETLMGMAYKEVKSEDIIIDSNNILLGVYNNDDKLLGGASLIWERL